MKKYGILLTITAVSCGAMLTGCGGGGGTGSGSGGGTATTPPPVIAPESPSVPTTPSTPSTPSVPNTPSPPAPTCTPVALVKIQLFGDSTMWGYLAGGGGIRSNIYPEMVLQRLMDNEFGAGKVKITTHAVSGTMASQLVAGTDGYNAAWPKAVDAHIVVLNYGINELRHNVPTDTYRANLGILASAPAPAKVVFQTPFPVYGNGTPSQAYASAMRAVAKERKVTLIDAMAYALSLPSWPTQYATDGFHATAAGYEIMATNVQYPVLSKLVKPLLCK